MALFAFRPSSLKEKWIEALDKKYMLSFDDWLMYNITSNQNIILIYTGNNRPPTIRAEDINETGWCTKVIETSDIIIFDLKSSTFDIFYEIRNILIYRPQDMWDTLEAIALRRLSADFADM